MFHQFPYRCFFMFQLLDYWHQYICEILDWVLQVKASLFAARCFCETSDDFACITVEMLFNMMNSSTVSLPVKLAAAQVFTKLRCSFSVANKAYKVVDHLVIL